MTIFEKENLSELKDIAKYIKQHDDYLEVVLKDGSSIKISKTELPPNSFEKLDQFILLGDEAEFKSTYKTYEEARERGFRDADIISQKTDIDVDEIKSVMSHVFLEKHDIPAQGGFIMKHDYLTANDEIAYAWKYTKETKNELTDNQKKWFKEWVAHEKQESKAMSEEGLPLRRIESWDGETYTGDPPGAHDKALKQKIEFDGYTSWFAREIMKQ